MISLIIPLYNHERYIDAALDSVICQSLPPTEIIVVDDGSTDGSWDRLQRRAEQDQRIICWTQPNQGAHQTINAALHRATGDYVAILNSDDCYSPERLARCYRALEEDPSAVAVCSAIAFVDGQNKPCRNKWYEEAAAFHRQVGDLALALINGNFLMTTSNLFIRRSIFSELGYFADLRYTHDLDFFLRIIAADKKISLIEEPLLHYRMHGANTISEDHRKVKAEWAAVTAFFAAQQKIDRDWGATRRLLEITDRHNLTRLIFLFLLYFRQQAPGLSAPDSYRRDPAFLALLDEVVQ